MNQVQDLKADFTLKDCLFGAAKLAKNADSDKYSYVGYGIRFDSHFLFAFSNFYLGKNVVSEQAVVHQCILIIRKRYFRGLIAEA